MSILNYFRPKSTTTTTQSQLAVTTEEEADDTCLSGRYKIYIRQGIINS